MGLVTTRGTNGLRAPEDGEGELPMPSVLKVDPTDAEGDLDVDLADPDVIADMTVVAMDLKLDDDVDVEVVVRVLSATEYERVVRDRSEACPCDEAIGVRSSSMYGLRTSSDALLEGGPVLPFPPPLPLYDRE